MLPEFWVGKDRGRSAYFSQGAQSTWCIHEHAGCSELCLQLSHWCYNAFLLLGIVINSLKDRQSVSGGRGVQFCVCLFFLLSIFFLFRAQLSQGLCEPTNSCFSEVRSNHQTMGTIHQIPHKAAPCTAKNM